MNEQWSVQRQGTLIAQKLRTHVDAREMMVWISANTLSEPLEENGWIFVEAQGAYAAVRPVTGGYQWRPAPAKAYTGRFMVCADEWSPVIVEAARKVEFEDFAAFRRAVVERPITFDNNVLRYRGLGGNDFVFYAGQDRIPEIDGETVDYAPGRVFDSPFLSSEWLSGVVTIRKGERSLVLDFNE